jgi:hypothetical protein
MKKSDSFKSDRLAWVFGRATKNVRSSARAFANFDVEVQDLLRQEADIENEEVPAIAHFLDAENWTLVTSRRLVWRYEGVQKSLKARNPSRQN